MTDPQAPGPIRDVQYKGAPLDAERGPGLGCFRFQLVVLAVLVVLTPLSVVWRWPDWLSAVLLGAVILLLLVAGQTIIFLLRLVAADRRAAGRRRPLASATKTVGELEDERAAAEGPAEDERAAAEGPADAGPSGAAERAAEVEPSDVAERAAEPEETAERDHIAASKAPSAEPPADTPGPPDGAGRVRQ